jgi:DNA-binding CsgD family transcriptional regulator/tetratricopeptide (TPR) repeat protein
MILSGDPGVGKTELLRSACRHAAEKGFLVLSAQGSELEGQIDYSGLQQLLLQVWSEVERGPIDRLKVLRIALGMVSGPPPSVDRIAEKTALLLVDLSRNHPVLVAINDANWLDRASSQVLAQIVTRRLTGGARIGFLSTSRVRDDDLSDRTDTIVLNVEPLSETASEALLTESFPHLARDRRTAVLKAARGNPLALLELARLSTGTVPFDASSAPLSYSLVEAFGSQLEALDGQTRRLALLAALDCGRPTVAAPTVSTDEDVVDRLRDIEPTAIVYWQGGRGIRFLHPLTARVIVQQADQADVREAHRALGSHYAQDPSGVEVAAWHFAEAATSPDDEVANLLERASAVMLGRGDALLAIDSLLRAAFLSEKAADRTRRISQAALVSCDSTGNLAAAGEMLTAARAADPDFRTSLAAATAIAATLFLGEGDIDAAHRLLISSIEDYPHREDGDDQVLIDSLTMLHRICWHGGRAELWVPYRRAIERLHPAAPPMLRLSSYTFPDPARITPAVRAELMDQISVLGTHGAPVWVIGIGIAACHFDQIAQCRPVLARIADDGRHGGAVVPAIGAMYLMGLDDFARGHWAACRALLTEGIELAERHGHPTMAWTGYCQFARLSAAEGKEGELADCLARLEHWALPRGLRAVMTHVHYASALAASGRGDFRAAYRHAKVLSPPGTFAPFVSMAPQASYELVEAAMRTGQREAALRHAEAVKKVGMATWSTRWRLVAASCVALAEETDPSIERLRAVLAEVESACWPFDRARGQFVVGAYLRRRNQVVESRSHLAAAARTFAELGASSWAGRAREELAATAPVRRWPEAIGSAALSAQERRVVELAVDGLRTKQIAEQLGISPRTVSNHLYRAFPKLGVVSRAGLRRALNS